MTDHSANKQIILDYFDAIEKSTSQDIAETIGKFIADDYHWYGVYPFEEQNDANGVADAFWKPFLNAWSPVRRRQDVFIGGTSEVDGTQWVTSMGHFQGLFDSDWLGIPATGKMAYLRYAEFHNIKDGKIVRSSFFCDIIGVMHQAGINPLPMQTGASVTIPGPRTHDGIQVANQPQRESEKTMAILNQMIADLDELNHSGENPSPELLGRSWHSDMNWYGPAGIGSTYTIRRYQEQHSFPFREGLKDKVYNGHICRYAEGNYACFFGWPNLTHTPIGGFLGLPGNDCRVDMRVVDVYRRQDGKLAENWVIIDLPWWLKQQGIDILERCKNITS
ncbi:MAG: ester cyclase [Porticoccaceae bacterium]|nr:ester cyclase [Porticoccaceae bacterium]